jgi:hypothetical protein
MEVTAEAVAIALEMRRSAVTTNSSSSSESATEPEPAVLDLEEPAPPSKPGAAPAAHPNPANESPRQAANVDALARRMDHLIIESPSYVLLVDAN